MSRFRALFVNLPVSRKLVVVLWLFVITVIALLILSYEIIGSLSALRAYVEGEGLWSKGQKQAVHDLVRYASSHSEQDFRAYQQALQTPLSDKKARLELEKAVPDLTIVYEGFIQGRNSPDDVKSMAVLFRRFHRKNIWLMPLRSGRMAIRSLHNCRCWAIKYIARLRLDLQTRQRSQKSCIRLIWSTIN